MIVGHIAVPLVGFRETTQALALLFGSSGALVRNLSLVQVLELPGRVMQLQSGKKQN